MKIIYLAKHYSGGNDDEGAIAHALELLGHEVFRFPEQKAYKLNRVSGDLLLFHHMGTPEYLHQAKVRAKVFWYFDLVDYPDPTLARRNEHRKQWMSNVVPHVDLGFCTDGDWVAKDTTDKLIRLMQGADSRVMGPGRKLDQRKHTLLFTGIYKGGQQRMSFVEEMRQRYPRDFVHVERKVHGRTLADYIASTKIVLAPDGPVTDRYWSNRVYLTLGFGGFLLHPYCVTLAEQYEDGKEIVFYLDRQEMHEKIEYYLPRWEERLNISLAGFERTVNEHTYTHRVQKLMQIVQERLF